MSAPRHLWSGDWQHESSAHAEDLAARRGRRDEPPAPDPSEPTPPPRRPRRRIPWASVGQSMRVNRRRLRVALLAALATLLIVAVAYGVNSNSNDNKTPAPAAISGSEAWLGVDLANAPIRGALVASVIPGSPAAAAGIEPGDVITQLDTQPIVTPAILTSAIAGLQPGDTVDIQLQRGQSQHTAHLALGSRPAGTP